MEVFIRGDVRTHVCVQGGGSPVLFLHGNPDTCELWDGVAQQMAPRHRCLAPDLPGFGRSEVPAGFDCSLEELATWVGEVIVALGITEPLSSCTISAASSGSPGPYVIPNGSAVWPS